MPPEYRDQKKDILTNEGIKIGSISGRKTPEELEAERVAAELALQIELQKRADKALLATYLSVDEILMHRDRRVELFKAQSKVTELFLTNLAARLLKLEREASRYQPYSADSDADRAVAGEISIGLSRFLRAVFILSVEAGDVVVDQLGGGGVVAHDDETGWDSDAFALPEFKCLLIVAIEGLQRGLQGGGQA